MHITQPFRRAAALAALCLAALGSLLGVAPSASAAAATPAPKITVAPLRSAAAPGETVGYKITVANGADEQLSRAQVTLAYDRGQLRPVDTKLRDEGDWVSALTSKRLTVTFAPIAARGQRSATVFFTVQPGVPDGTLIGAWSWNTWWTASAGGKGNEAQGQLRIVAPGRAAAALSPAAVRGGGQVQATGDHFLPHERVTATVLAADGSALLTSSARADRWGVARVTLASAGLAAGQYRVVLRGQDGTLLHALALSVL